MVEKICLKTFLSLGDILVMTTAVESLHRQFPGRYETYVQTSCDEVWEHNPLVTRIPWDAAIPEGIRLIECNYPTVNQSNQRAVTFLNGYLDDLGKQLGIPLEQQCYRPHVYLSKEEAGWISMIHQHITHAPTKYWLVSAGCKKDYTIKMWHGYQQVVDHFAGRVQFVQIGKSDHQHPLLKGVINLIDQTNVRQLIRLAQHAQGGLGPITALNHLLAAFDKPYVCIGGGREPAMWMHNYMTTHVLHAGASMPCITHNGCWLSRVVPLGDGDKKDEQLCKQPMFVQHPFPVARCMALITPQEVCLTIERILNGLQ